MALFQLERGQLKAAIDHLQQVILLTPENATALTNLGSAYLLNGQLQAAADTYQQALKKSPEPVELRRRVQQVAAQRQRFASILARGATAALKAR